MANAPYYIPPEGLLFHLVGHASKKALVSRAGRRPHVTQKSFARDNPEQLFTLIHSTEQSEVDQRYAIMNKATGNCITSSRISEIHPVWHRNFDDEGGDLDDLWFNLEPGEGAFKGLFRLINKDTIVLNDGVTSSEPYLSNEVTGLDNLTNKRPEQYFKFIPEKMQFLRIEYDLATGIIHDPQTHVLGTQTMVNQTSREQEFRFELDASKIHTGTWEYSHGFPIKATAAFETGIPMVLEGKISMIDVSHMEKTWKFDGHKHAFSSSKLWKASLPVNVAPGESVRVTTTIVRGHLEVPFTIVLRSKSTDLQVRTHGIWRGMSTWDLRHAVTAI